MAAAVKASPNATGEEPSGARIGFVSTAQIGRKNRWAAGQAGVNVVAVASRALAPAQAFADAWKIGKAFGSYEELLADPTIQGVYIPLPTAMHHEWVLKAAAAGKHVLCDKPTAVSLKQLGEMTSACRKAGVQFMDGVMFQHNDRLVHLRKYIDDKSLVGDVRRVTTGFTFNAGDEFHAGNIRVDPALEPAGCLGDLGWYCIRFTLFALNYDMPSHASAVAHQRSAKGVPTEATATLYFSGGRVATFDCGFHTAFRQWAEVAGTKGHVTLDDFCLNKPSGRFTTTSGPGLVDLDRAHVGHVSHVEVPCNQEIQMWRDFGAIVVSGAVDKFWPRVALQTQAVLDACCASADADGVRVAVAPIGDDY